MLLAGAVVPPWLNLGLQASALARRGPAATPLLWLGRWKPEAPVLQREQCETSPVIHKLGGNKKKKKLVYNFHARIHVLQSFFFLLLCCAPFPSTPKKKLLTPKR